MATFGRRPTKTGGALGGSTARRGDSGGSDAFRRLQEEEAERERFAKEYEQRQEREKKEREAPSRAKDPESEASSKQPNPRVFLDLEVRGPELLGKTGRVEGSGRLEFELRADVVPRTAENFRCLCTGERNSELHFERSIFHRIIPGFMAQGGDITDSDGTGGKSIYGKTFADEGFSLRHDRRGLLSMANSGKNTNGSQFFILFAPAPHLNGKHVVFGHLLRDEQQVLRKVEDRGSKSGDVKGTVVVKRSGELAVPRPQRPVRRDRGSSSRSPAGSSPRGSSPRRRRRQRSRSRQRHGSAKASRDRRRARSASASS